MSTSSAEKETYLKLIEHNSWEGETWCHYFTSLPGVKEELNSLLSRLNNHDYSRLETVELTDEEATVLANLDNGGYMEPHWFGELNVSKLATVVDFAELYKGQIRQYAEEIFEPR